MTQPRSAASRPRRSAALLTVSTGVVAVLLVPLAFLLYEAHGAGVTTMRQLIFTSQTRELLWNTVRLTVTVTAACAVVGTVAAWFVERTDLPGRRLWAVLVVVPLAIPDFVVSWGWFSVWPWVNGFRGAVFVMTLAVYPLVYLPVAASLRHADPGQEEVARSLGAGRVRTFFRVTLGQARGAILGGCLLVALVVLAEYGAFEVLGYQTFTTEIFRQFGNYAPTGFASFCALSLILVLLSLLVLAGEGAFRGSRGSRPAATAPGRQPQRLGHARWPVLAGFGVLVSLALGVPVGVSVYWTVSSAQSPLAGGANVSLLDAAWHTALYSGFAAAAATVMALPVALLVVRHDSRVTRFLERCSYLVLAMPGVVIGLALIYFTELYANGFLSQTPLLLIVCYAVMFFPLALVGVKASIARAPAGLEEVARSLGASRLSALSRVTLRLAAPGLAASFCLVFLTAVTELTATLLLVPPGVQTLATQFWSYQQSFEYGQAAPFALVMIIVAAVPSYVLGRFFDRRAHPRH